VAVVRRELRSLGEIENRIDPAQQVIGGDALFKIKPVDKPAPTALPSSPSPSIRAESMESRFAAATNAEFFRQNSPFQDTNWIGLS